MAVEVHQKGISTDIFKIEKHKKKERKSEKSTLQKKNWTKFSTKSKVKFI